MLDHPEAIPTIRVLVPDRPPVEIKATLARPKLVARGLHATGLAGFQVDNTVVTGIAKLKQIEIQDVDSGVLLYRRRQKDQLSAKLFRCELQAMPQPHIDRQFTRYFTMSYQAVERYSADTIESIVANRFSDSIYIAGRLPLSEYQKTLKDCGFRMATSLQEPFEELAERLLFLRYATSSNRPVYIDDYLTGFEPLLKIAQRFDIADEAALQRLFENLDPLQKTILSNPLVRLLACEAEEDSPQPKHIERALYNLASFDLVGLHSRYAEFRSMLREILQVDILGGYQPHQISWTAVVGEKLARIDQVKEMLALDIELYGRVQDAIEAVLENKNQVREFMNDDVDDD